MTKGPRLNSELAETKARYEALQLSDGGAPKSLAENRAQQARLLQHWCEGAPEIAGNVDLIVPTRHGPIGARLSVHNNAESGPVAIFLHGGGWLEVLRPMESGLVRLSPTRRGCGFFPSTTVLRLKTPFLRRSTKSRM